MKVKKKTKKYETEIEKRARRNNVPIEFAISVILRHHELEKLIPKKDTEVIQLDTSDKKIIALAKKVSKVLKVSLDAVFGAAALNGIKENQNS